MSTIALSGATALAAEAVWTRLLSLLLGATTYTFSLILAAFLIGLGIGSSIGSVVSRTVENPRTALGICQLLLTGAIAWAAYSMTRMLPYWPVNPGLVDRRRTYTFQIDLVRCLWAVLPAAIFWGASFPLALAAVGRDEKDPGTSRRHACTPRTRSVASSARSFGSLLIIAWLGTQARAAHSHRVRRRSARSSCSFRVATTRRRRRPARHARGIVLGRS